MPTITTITKDATLKQLGHLKAALETLTKSLEFLTSLQGMLSAEDYDCCDKCGRFMDEQGNPIANPLVARNINRQFYCRECLAAIHSMYQMDLSGVQTQTTRSIAAPSGIHQKR
jgi:hypothetical protein